MKGSFCCNAKTRRQCPECPAGSSEAASTFQQHRAVFRHDLFYVRGIRKHDVKVFRQLRRKTVKPDNAAAAKGRSRTSLCCSALPERSRRIRSCSKFFVLKLFFARSLGSALHREMTSLKRLASADEAVASASCMPHEPSGAL